ncbi:MAG: transglycosylase SLT domain-containing protein [Candidatus Hinthialibacter antarcticus]|nr:transglycosylase SLT domain-containing protein [Candidatus Hinthialibacter antarcticus]
MTLRFTPLVFLFIAINALAQTAQDLDLVKLKNGTLLEGCIVLESNQSVKIENGAGAFAIPKDQVDSVVHAERGESELLLGQQLFQRSQFDRARAFLQQASRVAKWRAKALDLIERLNQEVDRQREKEREEKARKIERLIQQKGIKQALEELKQKNENDDLEFWGGMRGKLHMAMARERMDHLDLRSAERHLVLAADYGVDPATWEKVRQELVQLRTYRLRYGADALAEHRPKAKKKPAKRTEFLASVKRAQSNGEKLPPLEWLEWVDQYAEENQLDPLLVWALIDVESSWRKDVISHKGAQGLMQLMPGTAKDVDVTDPFNPEENIRGGTRYIRFLLDIFNDEDKALAAYNTGPGRVERSGVTGAGQRYIEKVRTRLQKLETRFG